MNPRIPFLDLNAAHMELLAPISDAMSDVLQSGHYITGPHLARFEKEFADYCGTKYCVGVANGLDAITLSLRALDIGPGDEVIVPAHTFIASWLGVSAVGATLVPVETDAEHGLSVEATLKAITQKTKALMPVHLYGLPAKMDELMKIARERGLHVIEDAAQAHGAAIGERKAGSFGITGCFSFYPGKNLGAIGDGGAVTTNDKAVYERLMSLRGYGSKVKYHHDEIGVNSRLDELQAAVLSVKLKTLDEWNDRRQVIAKIYQERLAGLPGLALPVTPKNFRHVWHLFVVQTERRDELAAFLDARGVQTLIHYPISPINSKAYANKAWPTELQRSMETLTGRLLSLPIGPHLSIESAERVAREIGVFFNS